MYRSFHLYSQHHAGLQEKEIAGYGNWRGWTGQIFCKFKNYLMVGQNSYSEWIINMDYGELPY